MISGASLPSFVNLNSDEIAVAMLSIIGFTESEQAEVLKITEARVTTIRKSLRGKMGGSNTANMSFHCLQAGFDKDCTLQGEDIFTEQQKLRVLVIDPTVKFRFPTGKKK
jgi:hypothetical protein